MENYKKLKIIKDSFYSYFRMAGYENVTPAPLIPENDDSIFFSNSAINPFKPFLKNGETKLLNLQKCVRFRGGKDFFNIQETPYMSTFDMAGVLTPANLFNDITEDSRDFLLNTLEIPKNNLYIDASSKDSDFAKYFAKYFNIKFDRFPQEKYNNNFGLEGVSGRCIHFSMLYGNEKNHNFGKIIKINSYGENTSYAFGFGLEKILYMQDNRNNYYEATSIYDLTKDIESPISWKYMNAISTMCYLYSQNIDFNLPEYNKQKKIVRSMLYKLATITEILDIPDIRLRRDAELYSKLEFQGRTNVNLLLKDVNHSKENNKLKVKDIINLKQEVAKLASSGRY